MGDRNRSGGRLREGVGTGLVVALIAGCASLPPQRPVTDLRSIAGTWEGTVVTAQGASLPSRATINADGSGVTTLPVGPGRFDIVYQVRDGAVLYTSKTSGRTGTCRLHEGDGRRVLSCRNDDGSGTMDLVPAR
jgi:hypothetical protein